MIYTRDEWMEECGKLAKVYEDSMNTTNMTDADLTQYLVDSSGVSDLGNAKMAYAAGYFESTLLSLMARYPEVRREIEDRVNFRKNEIARADRFTEMSA